MRNLAILVLILVLPNSAFARLAVLVLPLQVAEQDDAHWQTTTPLLLKMQLRIAGAIRVLPDDSIELGSGDDSVDFATRAVGPWQSSFDTSYLRRIGQAVEADRVIWGVCQKDAGVWKITLQVLNVGTGVASAPFAASSAGFFEALCKVRRLLLENLGIPVLPKEAAAMDRPPTPSFAALELMSRALADEQYGRPLVDAERRLRQALSLDPDLAMAQVGLGHILAAQGQFEQVVKVASKTLQNQPNFAAAHYLLGVAYLRLGLREQARTELSKVLELFPEEPHTLIVLAQMARLDDKPNEAVHLLREANKLAPVMPSIHEELAFTYAELGRRAQVLAELALAEHFDTGTEAQSLLSLGEISEQLREIPKAIHYYEAYLSGMERVGFSAASLEDVRRRLSDLKSRLETCFVTAPVPKTFTAEELNNAMRLTSPSGKSVVAPILFRSTPEMTTWAKRTVGDTKDDLTKAKRLFDVLSLRIGSKSECGQRTAVEAFRDWSGTNAGFSCEDYAVLFTALARSVGLRAFYVLVDTDCRGRFVAHACAGVFIGTRAVLIDPSYFWFGVPHRSFSFQNDLQATAIFLSQSGDSSAKELAARLFPDSALIRFNLALDLAAKDNPKSARAQLKAGLKLAPQSWLGFFANGVVDLYAQNVGAAVEQLKKSAALGPDYPALHYYLAKALDAFGDLDSARHEFRFYLQCDTRPDLAQYAGSRISHLNGVLRTDNERD